MTHLLGDLPEVGQTISYRNLDLEVVETERHRIERIRVICNPEEKEKNKIKAEMNSQPFLNSNVLLI